ncbi:hypothetical protein I3843_Q044300 [Carya illinoinensis]|nr:hypothetical protein I3843_Q044300 [Carya illinoinensis]
MAATEKEPTSVVCNLGILDTLRDDSIQEVVESYSGFCATTEALLKGAGDLSAGPDFVAHVHSLCKHGLHSLVRDHFLRALEETFVKNGASKFWRHFDAYSNVAILSKNKHPICEGEVRQVLCIALEEIALEKQYQEKCLLMLVHALQSYNDQISEGRDPSNSERDHLFSTYQLLVSSVLMARIPRHFNEILHCYFKGSLEELSTIMAGEIDDENEYQEKDDMDLDEKSKISYRTGRMEIDESCPQVRFSENNKLVKNIGKVVRDLRSLGFTSMTEDAYASAIFLLLNAKVHNLAGDDYRSSVLESIKGWIQAVPLQFLRALLAYLGDSVSYESPSSGLKSPLASRLVRWQLWLEYFAYETLQDLRIAKLFEIIVDYPDSSPAIEDLKQCLEYTGQHSKLVESFFLEAVGEPIRDYLRGRKDTIKCIVTILTDGSGGNPNVSGNTGDSLLEELTRDEESQENSGVDDDFITDDKQAWIDAARYLGADPLEADPLKGSRNWRKVDMLGMLIRTLEIFKIHFGESSMQKCEIMLNDLIDSKRTNTNIKATITQPSQTGSFWIKKWDQL